MRLDNLRRDESAVSPVIGVILMVAITVILAAVIATFVLGLGDSISNTSPQASFSFDYEGGGTDTLEITHDSGDSIKANGLYVRGDTDGGPDSDQWDSYASATVSGSNSEVVAGDSVSLSGVGPGYDIRVVYQSEEGGTSATLGEDSGPDA